MNDHELRLHEKFMRIAIRLAKRATRAVSPNPKVGAVVVSGNTVVGKGYHKQSGGPHAEIFALREAGEKSRNATLYITLEPCSTHGKTPPCTDAIVSAGIKTVVIGSIDPNPKHAGKAIDILTGHNIKVKTGILENECDELIEDFRVFTTCRIPFVIVKVATSLDGKIATHTGKSKWITSPDSRTMVQRIRSGVDAIMVGATTVVRDNPALTIRHGRNKKFQPYRIIIDPELIIPSDSTVVSDPYKNRTVIITCDKNMQSEKFRHFSDIQGIKMLTLPFMKNTFSTQSILEKLADMDIVSVLIEGGGTTVGHFFDNHLIDKVYCFIAPKIIGGRNAPGPFHGYGIADIENAVQFEKFNWKKCGQDIVLCGYPRWPTT
ncbi:MAG: bifunctional diaminohydroxyphosphoribosylaminopyrimidine deaminase/5-amino-6-(5-phosphoribosylamino)uracil reductase RibD [Candidatus Auribacterota bacterium]|jgi:diaminohydroxyphosphoribosylaminopyrimidine deaminase/5-amino-6-(5-phosphoribosylamino)uracil reductase|nr:bifunctional diaminohydroxyphosphoribosylaminopyrimidine deaminase/5-amino-6-(5-phosphoribosylamino)uracil reductase RibD [Candidatus Auribacterota bacterium]